MIRLEAIARYPIKSVGREMLDSVTLAPAEVLPRDRAWAVLHEGGLRHLDEAGALRGWLPKSAFLNGARGPALQAIELRATAGGYELSAPESEPLQFDPVTSDPQLLLDWLAPMWPEDEPAPARLVSGPDALTDSRAPYISVLNDASLQSLEYQIGVRLGRERWRGNLWLDGWDAWAEADAIGATLSIGEVQLRIVEPIGRCAATSANTETGKRDGDMPAALMRLRNDTNFGVYAEVISGGTISTGDSVTLSTPEETT